MKGSSKFAMACALALATCLAMHVVPAQAIIYDNVWTMLKSRQDTTLAATLIGNHPDLQLMLSDPLAKVTMFVPSDNAIIKWLKATDRSDAVKYLLSGNAVLFPATAPVVNNAFMRKSEWQALNNHILQGTAARRIQDLPNGQYRTALALDGMARNITVSRSGDMVMVGSAGSNAVPANVIKPNLKAGMWSMIHIIDSVMVPSFGNPKPTATIVQAVNPMFASVLTSMKTVFDLDASPVQLTVLAPTDAAMTAWLRSANITMAQLLADKARSERLVKAHVVVFQGLFANDLLGLAAAGQQYVTNDDGSKFLTGSTLRHNFLNRRLQVKTTYVGGTAGPLRVGFSDMGAAAEPTVWATLTSASPDNLGGTEAGTAVISLVHSVDAVLL